MKHPVKVLLFEDNDLDAEVLKDMLDNALADGQSRDKKQLAPFHLQRVVRLLDGLEHLAAGNVDLILLDLCLPDSQGLDTFRRVHRQAPKAPLIVLTGHDDQETAIKTMQEGAQDYLVKGRIDAHLLVHAMRYAVERKRAEETIRRAKEEAERASHAKGQFLSRMSHELRTPLNAILGFAQLLESDTRLTDRESVDQILKAGRHLLDLINEVLEFSRLETGRLAIPLEPVGVAAAVREVLDFIRPLAVSRKVSLIGEDALNPAQHVQANRQRLKQVLLNLLSNAVKYNRAGGSVTISCEKSLRPRDTREFRKVAHSTARDAPLLRISVADTGHGIAPENLTKLFIPFERFGADESGIEGTGLGLAVSKALAQAMGGAIGAESDLGHGSIFWIELPQTNSFKATEDSPASPDSNRQNGNRPSAVSDRKTVLYVEDNLSNLRLIDRVLAERPGITLLSAMRGALGLDLARQNRPHLILLDLNLPDMHGADVLRCLREDSLTASIPVVVISADATATQIERLLAAGARNYLTKPIDVKQFLVTVDELLQEGDSPVQPQIAEVRHE
jgi:signal transduction histidine kinase